MNHNLLRNGLIRYLDNDELFLLTLINKEFESYTEKKIKLRKAINEGWVKSARRGDGYGSRAWAFGGSQIFEGNKQEIKSL